MEVGAIPGENQAMYDKICRSLVQLVWYDPTGREQKSMTTGAIAKSGNDYCYIIALWNVRNWSSIGLLEVVLPDRTKIKLQKKEVETRERLMAFYVRTPTLMKSVEFSTNDISLNEEVFTVGFQPSIPSCHMSPGLVTHERKFYFSHDSHPTPLTSLGDLVFNKQAEFVGISCMNRGVTIAMNVASITQSLSLFHKNMTDKSLGEILQHIDVQARSVKKRNKDDQATSHKKRKKKRH